MTARDAAIDVAAGDSGPPASLVELAYRKKLLVVAALSVTLFVTTMSQTVVATAAQSIVADIGGFDQFIWLFAGFSLAGAVAIPIVGKLSDITGRKRVIVWSLLIFIAASLAAGFAQSMNQLIAIRVVQGVGFAGAMGSTWIIMAALWPPADRAKWMGVTAASFTLSGVMGPVIGGVLADIGSWRWIFFLNVPIGALAVVLLLVWLPNLREDRRHMNFDLAGTAAFVIFSTASLFALSIGGVSVDWISPVMGGLGLATVVGIVAFVFIERRAVDPLVPLELFKSRVFSAGMVASLSIVTSFIVVTAFLPLFIQGVKGGSATTSAIPLMSLAVGTALGSNISGQLLSRYNRPREGAIFGLGVAVAVLLWLGGAGPDTSMWAIALSTGFLGVGLTFGWTAYTAPIQNAMPDKVLGVVTSSLQFARMFGMAAGAAALGAILASQLAGNLGSGLTGPAAEFTDPGLLIAEERLEDVREEYLLDPSLGQTAFDSALRDTRESLADALGIVFRVSAAIASLGVFMSFVTFYRYRVYVPEPAPTHPGHGGGSRGARRQPAPSGD